MRQFFYFYTMEDAYAKPFPMFSIQHLLILILVGFCIYNGFRYMKGRTPEEIHAAEKRIITIFVLEEWFYYLWNILFCPNPPYTEIIPLHLCSTCIYISAIAIFLDKERLRRYMAVTNIIGALIALCYPATVGEMYPILSYRVIYFFISHGTILFLGILQIQRFGRLRYGDMKFNIAVLAVLATLAFCTNLLLHTDYMFIGVPPTIGIIGAIYQVVGIYLYLPVAILILGLLEMAVMGLINGILDVAQNRIYQYLND